jgi:predicted TIM-barrel fold metal-dependent hydrolase
MLMLELDIIDAHHHLCNLSQASYPWLEGSPVARYHGDDSPLRRDYLLVDYLTDTCELAALDAQLVGSVHIENGAADPVRESVWIDQVISANGIPTVQVVKVDLTSTTARDELAHHANLPSVRGVRDILNWHPNSLYTHRDRPDLMTDPAWLDGFAAIAEFRLSFDLQVFPAQLEKAAALAAAHGDIPIVLDHAGMPIERDPEALHWWKQQLAKVAAEPNTAVKISALGTNDHRWTIDSIRRIVLDTIDVFGPSRCMFASNFPVDGLYSTLGELFRVFDTITTGFSHSERADLFAGAARSFYRIQSAALSDIADDLGDASTAPRAARSPHPGGGEVSHLKHRS